MRREHRFADEFFFSLSLVAGTQRVIEDHHARSPGFALNQLLDLGIVDRLQLRWVEEVCDLGLVLDENKTLLLQRKPIGEQAAVLNRHLFQLVRSRLAPANVVRAECLVHEFLARVHRVRNTNSHSFNHNEALLFLRLPYHQARYYGNVLSLPIRCLFPLFQS